MKSATFSLLSLCSSEVVQEHIQHMLNINVSVSADGNCNSTLSGPLRPVPAKELDAGFLRSLELDGFVFLGVVFPPSHWKNISEIYNIQIFVRRGTVITTQSRAAHGAPWRCKGQKRECTGLLNSTAIVCFGVVFLRGIGGIIYHSWDGNDNPILPGSWCPLQA